MKNIKSINEFWGAVIRRDMSSAVREEDKFHSREELQEYLMKEIRKQGKDVVIKNLDVSGIEDLRGLFKGLLDGVKTLDLPGWNTSNVREMDEMFECCDSLTSLDLSDWDTGNVRSMYLMFGSCEKLKSIDLSGWDTSNVKNMCGVFFNCRDLNDLDLSGWDTSGVVNMYWMFQDCESLQSLDLSGWDTSSVEYIKDMFDNCPAPYEVVDNKIVRK